MNDHDIRLIEIGQKEGYDRAVKEIVAHLREHNGFGAGWYGVEIEAKFGEQKKNTFLQGAPPVTLNVTHKEQP